MHQGLRELAAQLARTGYFNVTISAMYSPPGALSTPNHIDTCDVLAIQLHGEKSWTVDSQPRTRHAHPRQIEARSGSFDFIDSAEYTTRVGDALFIPRGFLHNAMATEQESLQLVIGLVPLTWFDVMAQAVQELCDTEPDTRAAILDQRGDLSTSGLVNRDAVLGSGISFNDPEALNKFALKVMRKRAREHMLNAYGQIFAGSPDDFA